MATVSESTFSEAVPALADLSGSPDLTFFERCRKFLWLASGLFSAACFAVPAIGALAYSRTEGMSTSFLAAVVSGCLFGVASLLHFGPETA